MAKAGPTGVASSQHAKYVPRWTKPWFKLPSVFILVVSVGHLVSKPKQQALVPYYRQILPASSLR